MILAGCGADAPPRGVPVDTGRSDSERVLRFYLGSYMAATRVDSVLLFDGTRWRIDLEGLERDAPGLLAALGPAAAAGRIERDELRSAVQATYATARDLPANVDGMLGQPGFEGEHLELIVHGSMTAYERRIRIPVQAVEAAIREFAAGRALTYPVGTVVVGEHLDGDEVVETTAMVRRDDGFWDFVAYGAGGDRVDEIRGDRGALAVPTRCFGCHYGSRAFEPEASFPAPAADGPHGPRFIDVPNAWIDDDLVRRVNEHRSRADGLLGLYATLLIGKWKAESRTLAHDRAQLLETLGM